MVEVTDAMKEAGVASLSGPGAGEGQFGDLLARAFAAMLLAADEDVMERNGWVRVERRRHA